MIIKINIYPLNDEQAILDNSWLLGKKSLTTSAPELATVIDDQDTANKSAKDFNIIFENNQIFLAYNEMIENITINEEKQMNFADFIVKAKIVNNKIQEHESLAEYFNPKKTILVEPLKSKINFSYANDYIPSLKFLDEQAAITHEFTNWYSSIKDYESEETKLSSE